MRYWNYLSYSPFLVPTFLLSRHHTLEAGYLEPKE
ncbi:hypothetical protein Spb1_39540 [Planctopirus ephydatiae]|uniref:Uncharacterized protein n=1 Tax=Planctopirus ephydatiae TaxID=2528019 RepID=A0A518GTU0_9PLAN|nr:hypothetical protein Spb1_39540 [Planctopirus ephydatiae]